MKTIVVKTQKELDALPDSFEEFAVIEIRSEALISVKKARENSSVEAYGNSSVVAYGNSSVEAWGNSSVVAYGNSRVEAWENSSVVAYGNSSVVAYGNSRVEAWGNSSVVAWGNSSVVAYGNSSVVAYENSSVVAYENSSVVAYGNSSVVAYENSSVVAYGNSQLELFLLAYVVVLSSSVIIKKLLDHSTAVFKGCPVKIEEKSETAHAREVPYNIEVSFEEWLRRGYVYADGICKKLISQKKINDIEVFEVEEFIDRKSSYVVKRGDTFSHGETIEKAIEDLRFKISDRDVTKYEHWKNGNEISIDEAIQGYRVITGACEFGVKEFVKSIGELPEKITPKQILKLTKGKFGNDELREFLG